MASERPRAQTRLVVAVALSSALAPLNSTMVAVGLPEMQRALGVDSGTLRQCLVTSYLLTNIVLQSVGGKVADRVGPRRALAIGQAVFALGAVLSYLIPTLTAVTMTRIVMAAASAIIVPSALSLLRFELPPEQRGRAFGGFGAVMGLSAAIGPKVGGSIVSHFGWEVMFLANVPVLALSALLAHVRAGEKQPNRQTATASFDALGALLLGLSLAMVVIGSESHSYRFLIGLGVLGFFPFAFWQRKASDPIIDFSLFRTRAFTSGGAIIALQNFAMYALLFELPQVTTRLFGTTPSQMGSLLLSMMLAMVFASPISGRAVDRLGPRMVAIAGSVISLAGMASFALITFSSLRAAILPLVAIGFGLGLTTAPSQTAALSAVPREKTGMAAALTSTMRYLGGMAGLAALGLVLSDTPGVAITQTEHTRALFVFCAALSLALAFAFVLPRRVTSEKYS